MAGEERFRESNPIVWQALDDLTSTWWNLEDLYNSPYTSADIRGYIRQAQADVHAMANRVREIGDSMIVDMSGPVRSQVAQRFNATQQVLYASDPLKGQIVLTAALSAQLRHDPSDGTMENARKHAYWMAMSVLNTGDPVFARMFVDAHEFGQPSNFTFEPATGGFLEYQHAFMDLHNNAVGFALAMAELPYIRGRHDAADAARAIRRAIDRGNGLRHLR